MCVRPSFGVILDKSNCSRQLSCALNQDLDNKISLNAHLKKGNISGDRRQSEMNCSWRYQREKMNSTTELVCIITRVACPKFTVVNGVIGVAERVDPDYAFRITPI